MANIFFIDPIEKLNIKKDSTLFLATTLFLQNKVVWILFENDFYYQNQKSPKFYMYKISSAKFATDGIYLKEFILEKEPELILIDKINDVVHFRLDPPFDECYTRYLWMWRGYEEKGFQIVNSPKAILANNEKMLAYHEFLSLPTLISMDKKNLMLFLDEHKEVENFILKPMNLFQGIGVLKVNRHQVQSEFLKKVDSEKGPIIVQPFCEEIYLGEIRAIYMHGKFVGAILKVPPKDSYLANIAQGATFTKVELTEELKDVCGKIAEKLNQEKIHFIAFDLLGKYISEVNITCPGLLVELSFAHNKNFAHSLFLF